MTEHLKLSEREREPHKNVKNEKEKTTKQRIINHVATIKQNKFLLSNLCFYNSNNNNREKRNKYLKDTTL